MDNQQIIKMALARSGKLLIDPATQVCRYALGGLRDALGQFMVSPELIPRHQAGLRIEDLERETGVPWDKWLQKRYRGHPKAFWLDLERLLYSRALYSRAGNLNRHGHAELQRIRRRWQPQAQLPEWQLPRVSKEKFNL